MDSGDLNVEPHCQLAKLEVMGTCLLTHTEYASAKQVGSSIRGTEEERELVDKYFLQLLQWCARGGLYRLHMRQNLGPPVFFLTS